MQRTLSPATGVPALASRAAPFSMMPKPKPVPTQICPVELSNRQFTV
jgi:hypothetical protein